MDHYIVSARKYRPSTFASVIGQKPLTAALKHAIATDRLAHAYLFCGSRGVGKTSCARIFAKTINCQHRTPDGEACNECESCLSFNQGSSLNIIELDAASHNGVDDMKALIEQVQVPPTMGKYRVFIVDEVHMLSSAAFNAFLKTLEEPPEYVVFILATTEKHKIIPTILSRCQIYDFNRITIQDMVDHLAHVASLEGIAAEPAGLSVIAKKADGAMRDALSIFDQVAASSMGQITYQSAIDNLNVLDSAYYSRLVEAMLAGDVPTALLIYKEVRDKGFDSQFFINGMGQYFRDLMVARQPATLPLLEAADDVKAQMAQVGQKCSPQFLYRAMDICNDADLNYRLATNKQFLIELALVKLCQLCSPSPKIDGGGEGQLKPIAVAQAPAQPASAQAAPTAQAPTGQASTGQIPVGQMSAGQAHAPATPAPAAHAPAAPAVKPYPPMPAATPSVASDVRVTSPGGSAPTRPSISLSIKGVIKKEEKAPVPEKKIDERQPYAPADLEREWLAYAQARPTERILSNTMQTCKPQQIEGDRYFVAVDDAIQVNALAEAKQDILDHLRTALRNGAIDFEPRLTDRAPSPLIWNSQEVLQHMVDTHPHLAELIRDFKFHLA